MNAHERVAATVGHREPDRVPLDYWSTPEVDERLLATFNLPDVVSLRRYLKVDLMYVAPQPVDAAIRHLGDGDYIDEWGNRRHWQPHPAGGGYWERVEFPLTELDTIDLLQRYRWPEPEVYDWERFSRELDRYDGFVIYGGFLTVFARYWFLRGMENSLLDLALRPDFAHRLIERITDFECDFLVKTLEVADGRVRYYANYDDWGTQTGLMMSPKMFREFYKESLRRAFDLARSFDVGIFCHTDGSIGELMDDLVELGIDILNPVQTHCRRMDPAWLKRAYGDGVCFHGAIDTQSVMPFGTTADVRRETLTRLEQFGHGGGYIAASCHNLQPDVPTENIMALYETVWEHGHYPLDLKPELARLGPAPDG